MSFLDLLKSLQQKDGILDLSSGATTQSFSTVAQNTSPEQLISNKLQNNEPNITNQIGTGDINIPGTDISGNISTSINTTIDLGKDKITKPLIYPQDLFGKESLKAGLLSKNTETPSPFIYFILRDSNLGTSSSLAKVALYMPPAINVKYGANWESTTLDLSQVNSGISTVVNSADNVMQGTESLKDSAVGFGAASMATKALDTISGGNKFSKELGVISRRATNPHQAMLFNGVDFREFQFNFEFQARSYEESESIRLIIKLFKWAMHPGLPPGEQLFFTYPNIFDIHLYTPSNKWMFNIAQSVLTSMDVDYGGANATSFFNHPDPSKMGAPVFIKVSLTFKELSILSKESIKGDY
jgi:hypothetical protein